MKRSGYYGSHSSTSQEGIVRAIESWSLMAGVAWSLMAGTAVFSAAVIYALAWFVDALLRALSSK